MTNFAVQKTNKILSNSCVALQHSQTFLANCTEGGDALGHRETDWILLRLQHSPKSWPCHYAHLHWKWTEQGGFFFFNFIISKIWWTFPKKLANLCFSKFFRCINWVRAKTKQSFLEKNIISSIECIMRGLIQLV